MAVAKHYEAQLQVVAEGTHETYNDLLVCVGGRVGDVSAGAPPDAGASEWWQKPKYKAVLNEQDSAATTVQAAFRGQRDRRLVADRPRWAPPTARLATRHRGELEHADVRGRAW